MASTDRRPSTRSLRALDGLNFFLADVRDGLGPYLAIYLLATRGPAHGWDEATVGSVITISGLVGLVVQTPAGALIDRIPHRRMVLIVAAVVVTASCLCLPAVHGYVAVTATQSAAAAAATVFGPGIAAISLGLVGGRLLTRRIARNEAFNHAGNAASAGIAALLAIQFGPVVVFWLMAVLALLSVASAARIRDAEIDESLARGLTADHTVHRRASSWKVLFTSRTLLAFAAVVFVFHLSNAAMLTSVSQLLVRVAGKDSATSLTALCVLAAQLVMVPVAIVVGRTADSWGRKPIFVAGFAVLAVRGVLYTVSDNPVWLVAVQTLDGVGAGIFGALFPVVIADLTAGTGHFNVTQGALATIQGAGAAISAGLAGALIVAAGYHTTFITLSVIAVAGMALYLTAVPETRPPAQR
ncbi:MFS transporter [Mycolicibacterium sp. ELW1]|uniref:MFS transporter n=1 Tax=Mycobacteriaceae TaxID=1762 RepID=UPI0011EE4A16|nr:MFS transporter [Mycobacterium sp. ELW1]QEN15404.1 MFS transporter [Mycobacterium sp. ELW1]